MIVFECNRVRAQTARSSDREGSLMGHFRRAAYRRLRSSMAWVRPTCVRCRMAALLCCLLPVCGAAHAQAFWENTHLVRITDDGDLSVSASKLQRGGYKLSGGADQRFSDWYSSNWKDVHATFLTEITPTFGIFWGFGTGEAGAKYRIEPSLRVGFLGQTQTGKRGMLSLSVMAILAGRLKEENCIADYGVIASDQVVNCRLAATTLPPSETLAYTLDVPPADRIVVSLKYEFRF